MDFANKEQLSICLRFADGTGVHELFADFVEVECITGAVLTDTILQKLAAWGLEFSCLRGQCYDGSSNMVGIRSGCRALIQSKVPKATYTHCAAHHLNLADVSACKLQAFRSAESTIGEITRFFKFSSKRQRLLDRAHEETSSKPKKLKDFCQRRWIQHVDSYIVFHKLLPAVLMTLRAMVSLDNFQELDCNWNWDGETRTKANGFLFQLQSSLFLLSFKILLEVLISLRGLTLKLQMETIDVLYVYREVRTIVTTLRDMRSKSEEGFSKLFAETILVLEKLCMVMILCHPSPESMLGRHSTATYKLVLLSSNFVSPCTMSSYPTL